MVVEMIYFKRTSVTDSRRSRDPRVWMGLERMLLHWLIGMSFVTVKMLFLFFSLSSSFFLLQGVFDFLGGLEGRNSRGADRHFWLAIFLDCSFVCGTRLQPLAALCASKVSATRLGRCVDTKRIWSLFFGISGGWESGYRLILDTVDQDDVNVGVEW